MSPDTDNLMEQADQVVAKLKVRECFIWNSLCVGVLQAPIELSSDSGEDDAYASGHMVNGVQMWAV